MVFLWIFYGFSMDFLLIFYRLSMVNQMRMAEGRSLGKANPSKFPAKPPKRLFAATPPFVKNKKMGRKIHCNRTSNAQIRSRRTHDIQKSGPKPHFGPIQPEFPTCRNFPNFENPNKFKINSKL